MLAERKITRLGETTARAVDVCVIAISNRNLPQLVEAGGFLTDLYDRLKVLEIHLPPLRQRPEDIPLLAEHFYQQTFQQRTGVEAIFSPDVMEALQSYNWQGNVRQLRNAIRRACALMCTGRRRKAH